MRVRHRTGLVLAGLFLGVVGVTFYSRLREKRAEEDADALIKKISRQLKALDLAKEPASEPSA